MRIQGGIYRGRVLSVPPGIRPTQGVTRKAVFDIIGPDLTDCRFLDLCAGSGAVGLEALSRGARVTFVERDERNREVLEKNLHRLGVPSGGGEGRAEVLGLDVFAVIKRWAREGRTFDAAYGDPPYGRGLGKKLLKTLAGHDILTPNTLLIIEFGNKETLPEREGRFFLVRRRRYGGSHLAVYQGRPMVSSHTVPR